MFQWLFQFKIHRKIEENLKEMSAISNRFLKTLYEEFETMITPIREQEWEQEIDNCRKEIITNLNKSRINTSLKVEKYKLFLRLNLLLERIETFHHNLVVDKEKLSDKELEKLREALEEAIKSTSILENSVRFLYSDFRAAENELQKLDNSCQNSLEKIKEFKYPSASKGLKWDPKKATEIIGNSLRKIIQGIIFVKEKMIEITEEFRQDKN